MAISERLYEELAKARAQPSGLYKAFTEATQIPGSAMQGYETGAQFLDAQRKRKLEQQTLSEALGGQPVEQGIMNLTGESGAIQHPNLAVLAELLKAKKEGRKKGTQLFGTRGDKGLVFNPDESSISEIPIPQGAGEPILPKAVTPILSPYADPGSGQPLAFTPGRGLAPTASSGGSGGTPVLKQGNEQAINDVALMQSQAGNIDKLFNAYDQLDASGGMGGVKAKLQATPAGYALNPEMKQLENSLKLAAFTFGGKNLTANEKQVVFGAFFPGGLDNHGSRNLKRDLLKDYFSGKIDLLQAANLLGPAGAPLQGMLKGKLNQPTVQGQGSGDPEADAAIARVQSSNISENEKKARIAGIRAAAGQ